MPDPIRRLGEVDESSASQPAAKKSHEQQFLNGPALELVVRAQQERLLRVAAAADHAVHAGHGRRRPLLQRGLLRVLLVGRGEVVDGVLDHVTRVHGLLQAAGDALHRGTAAYGMEKRRTLVRMARD